MTAVQRWASISKDPNAPEVIRWRGRQLLEARRPPVGSRVAHLTDLARGRAVLDIGVVEHFVENEQRETWLHGRLAEAASSCRGVDVLEEEVGVLVERGYDVIVHDLTAAPLPDRFELVVMGDIIEHLGAPEPFLRNAGAAVAPGGRLVLTTPNPYMLNRAVQALRGGFPDSVDHAVLLGPSNVAELADRAGLRLDTWRGVALKDLPGWRNRLVSVARRLLVAVGFAAEIGCDTLIYELVPAD